MIDVSAKIRETLRTIRDQTTEKVRRREFAEKMTPEERARVEAALGRFTGYMNGAIDALGGDEEE